jgi:hypothetical protein
VGQSLTINMNATSLLDFSGNEVYGATPNGLTAWDLGTQYRNPVGVGGVIKNFLAWNFYQWGYFGYESNDLTIDGFVAQGNTTLAPANRAMGMWFGDYYQKGLVITNADIQGMNNGILTPELADGATTIENSTFRNVTDIVVSTMGSVNGDAGLPAKSVILTNDLFIPTGTLPLASIDMVYTTQGLGTYALSNLVQLDQVFVYDYNEIAGDDFQVYYTQQSPTFVVPQTVSSGPVQFIGSPVAGLTNEQNWVLYSVAIAGAVAPTTNTMPGITGLVQPIP